MDIAISAVGNATRSDGAGLGGVADNIVNALKAQEAKISDTFVEGLRPDGHLMKLPTHMTDQFKKWEEAFTSPEDLALVAGVKGKVIEMAQLNSEYIQTTIERKAEKVRLELAMKAVSKTTQGIQQLLSSQ
jgi:hypothetical protein